MAQYANNAFAGVVSIANINSEFSAIATAFNVLDSTNTPDDSIPRTALATDYAYFSQTVVVDAVGAGAAMADVQMHIPVPVDGTLVRVQAVATGKADGGGVEPDVDIYDDSTAATVLGSVIDLAVARTVYGKTPSVTSFSQDDVLSVRSITDGAGSITNLTVTLLWKALLTS